MDQVPQLVSVYWKHPDHYWNCNDDEGLSSLNRRENKVVWPLCYTKGLFHVIRKIIEKWKAASILAFPARLSLSLKQVNMLESMWLYIHLIRGFLHFHLNDNTARHQVTMKRIVCTIERAEMQINIIGRAEVMLIKTKETRRRGG